MNDQRIPHDEDGALPDSLRWQLRAQRRDVAPTADLWPGVAARIADVPRRHEPRAARFAVAAGLLLAFAAGGLAVHVRSGAATATAVATHEAQSLTREYERALRAMPAPTAPTELAPAFAELDRSARDIRQALRRDPDSRLLLDQLRRTYTLRLALSQRALLG